MSLVDYAIAVRRRPEWRRVRLQPGLWLAWAVMITALLMALAPQWFTSANPLEGIPGAQRLAPQAHYWLGTDQLGRDLWTRVVYGAVHSLSAALIAVAIGLVVGTALGTLAGALAGRVESTLMRLVDVLLAIPAAAAADGDHSAGFWHGECGGGGRRRGYRQLRAPGAGGSGARAPQRLRRSGPGQRRHLSRHLLASYPAQLAHRGARLRNAAVWSGDAGSGHPQLPRLRHPAAGPGVGITDRRRS